LLFQLLAHLDHSDRDFRLLVVGDGIERAHWEKETTRHHPGRVLFFGHIADRKILADIYANADLFVHPNPREPFGIAPLEAMASGLPVVAPNSGGITSYANGDNAWTVDPTVTSFAAAIEHALSDAPLRAAKVSAALETARLYDWRVVASSFLDLYSELHRSTLESEEALPAPAFCSTPATGLRAVLMRGASGAAAGTFKLLVSLTATLSPNNQSKRPRSLAG